MPDKVSDVTPLLRHIIDAVAEKRYSNIGDKFQNMLDEEVKNQEQAETVAEAQVDASNKVSASGSPLMSQSVPIGKCRACGKPVFGWKDYCRECEEAGVVQE